MIASNILVTSSQTASLAWTPSTLGEKKRFFFLGCGSLQIIQIQPLPDLREGCFPRNFRQVEFYVLRNFPKFYPIHFFLNNVQEKLQKYASKCTIKSLRQCRLRIFVVLVGSPIYFFSLHLPAEMYVKKNLRKSESYCIWFILRFGKWLYFHLQVIYSNYAWIITLFNSIMHWRSFRKKAWIHKVGGIDIYFRHFEI